MRDQKARRRQSIVRILGFTALVVVFVGAIWIDLATGVWQQAVILSGIAAGLLTFLLTALFFERWMAGADHRRWLPVTHLALTDLLHALGDEERSELSRGIVVPRSIDPDAGHDAVLAGIHRDRREISHALARWSGFLSASADAQTLMDHVAQLALLLDEARDAVIDADDAPEDVALRDTARARVHAVNASIAAAAAEIERTLAPRTIRIAHSAPSTV